MRRIRDTEKQNEIMGIVLREAGNGRFLSIIELHGLMTNPASYGALRKSLEWLEKRGLIARKREGKLVRLVPTGTAYSFFKPRM